MMMNVIGELKLTVMVIHVWSIRLIAAGKADKIYEYQLDDGLCIPEIPQRRVNRPYSGV